MPAPFAIDATTGRIRFPDLSLELRPGMPRQEFVAATAKLNRDNLGANAGWQRYSIRQDVAGDRKLGIFFVFFNELLKMVTFAYAPKDETWDNWSEEKEAARLEEYRQELDAQLGSGTNLSWGKVSVINNEKSGGTEITIQFNNEAYET
jgi:hypothetical protein